MGRRESASEATALRSTVEHTLHDGDGDPLWQESMFVAWFDPARGIGGAHRVGHEMGPKSVNLWSGVVTAEGLRWRQDFDESPMRAEDRTRHRYGAGTTAFIAGDAFGVEVRDSDVVVDLRLDDYYTPTPVWNSRESHQVAERIAPSHLEASGRAVGSVVIDGRHYDVDGHFHRDHSWGAREWTQIVSHRWVVGTCGPDLSFSAVVVQGPRHRYIREGAVVRDGVITPATSVDIVTWIEPDGISHRGGEVVWTLETGEELKMRCVAMDGMVFDQREFLVAETLCTVTIEGTGQTGVCDFEISNGIRHRPITHAISAVATDGLSRRDPVSDRS